MDSSNASISSDQKKQTDQQPRFPAQNSSVEGEIADIRSAGQLPEPMDPGPRISDRYALVFEPCWNYSGSLALFTQSNQLLDDLDQSM